MSRTATRLEVTAEFVMVGDIIPMRVRGVTRHHTVLDIDVCNGGTFIRVSPPFPSLRDIERFGNDEILDVLR